MEADEGSGSGDSILGELEDQVTCWICFEVFTDPVTLNCNHSFCRECCLKMYKKNPLCAFCRREFGLPLSATNAELVKLAAAFRKKQSGEPDDTPENSHIEIDQDSLWFLLPDEIMVGIFGQLPPGDLARMGMVCHHFHNIADDSFLWRSLCREAFPFVQISQYGGDWKKCFLTRCRTSKGWESGKPNDFKMQVLRGHKNYISCFDYYRNNVVSGSADSTINIWSTNKLKPIHTLTGHSGIINAIQFNEVRVVSGATDARVKIWDTSSGQTTHTMNQGGAVNCLQFNESRIVSGGYDREVKVWDVRSGTLSLSLQGHIQGVQRLDLTGNRVISTDGSSMRVYDVRTGACLKNLTGGTVTCFKPVGSRDVVTGGSDGTVRIWDIAAGTCTHAFAGNRGQSITGIECDGAMIVTGSSDNTIKVFDFQRKRHVVTLKDHTAAINAIQYDGHRIVSAGADNCLKVWDMKGQKRLYSLLGGTLQARDNNPPHPQKPGASFVQFDEGRIVAAFNSLLRVYNFTGESVEKVGQ